MTVNKKNDFHQPDFVKNDDRKFPRVLIVYMTCINKTDQQGISLRNWFAEWPKDCLAQIYSGGEVGADRFCGNTYKLDIMDRRWGSVFFKMKRSDLGIGKNPILIQNETQKVHSVSRAFLLKYRLSALLVNSGLWELIFPPILSTKLLQWVENFKPDVVYAQGYSLSFTWLPLRLQEHFQIPLVFQTGDDWPSYLYRKSPLAWLVRPFVRKAARSLALRASIRFANGPRMAQDYLNRFGVPFMPMMMCDYVSRFDEAQPSRIHDINTISIVYSGSLEHDRWRSIVDLARAVEAMGKEGKNIQITVYAWSVPPEAIASLKQISLLEICPPPSNDQVPGILKGADILFLPETFQKDEAKKIYLSISTKAHLYMMSRRPILVYGSQICGVVDYAKETGWAIVVDRRDPQRLMDAIKSLIQDQALRESLIRTGYEIAIQNHEAVSVRERFRQTITQKLMI